MAPVAVQAQVVPPSPEGEALVRSIDVPVDYSTGIPRIALPLHQIKYRDIVLPITLNYQASGIKIKDIATWAGLGWRLSAGGKVTRVVKGRPDEFGYSKRNGFPEIDYFTQYDPGGLELTATSFNNLLSGGYDSEPDIFYFELPGASGTFFCDKDGKAYTVPHQDVDIEWVGRYNFIISTADGTQYHLGVSNSSQEQILTSGRTKGPGREIDIAATEYISVWYLDRIVSPSGAVINFEYETGQSYFYQDKSYTYASSFPCDNNGKPIQSTHMDQLTTHTHTLDNTVTPRYLRWIKWSGGKIEFKSGATRQDIPNMRRVNSMELYNSEGTWLRTIMLQQDNFGNGSPRLLGVSDSVRNQPRRKICDFEYFTDRDLPDRNIEHRVDYWGYYNNRYDAARPYPSFVLTVPGAYNSKGDWVTDTYEYAGCSRASDIEYAKTYTLNKIVYPHGGYKQFIYESQLVGYDPLGRAIQGGGLRIKQIIETLNGETSNVTSYTYSEPVLEHDPKIYAHMLGQSGAASLDLDFEIPDGNISYTSDAQGRVSVYFEVTETLPDGSYTIYHYDDAHNLHQDIMPEVRLCFDDSTHLQSYYNECYLVPTTSQAWKRGLLMKTEAYTNDGSLVREETYDYDTETGLQAMIPVYTLHKQFDTQVSSGQLNTSLAKRIFSKTYMISQPLHMVRKTVKGGRYDVGMITSYEYDSVYQAPRRVTTVNARGDRETTESRYVFDYLRDPQTPATSPATRMMQLMLRRNLVQQPVEQIVYRQDALSGGPARIVAATFTDFQTDKVDSVVCIKTQKTVELQEPADSAVFQRATITAQGFSHDPRYVVQYGISGFDYYHNPIMHYNRFGDTTSTLYGYNGAYPIAVAEQASMAYQPFTATAATQVITNSTSSGTFYIGYGQYVQFTVQYPQLTTNAFSSGSLPLRLSIIRQGEEKFRYSYMYTRAELDAGHTRRIFLEPGTYTVACGTDVNRDQSIPSAVESLLNTWTVTVRMFNTPSLYSVARTQIFYEGFETNGITYANAKTGNRVYSGAYTCNLTNLAPGTYQVSYWEMASGSNQWERIIQTLDQTTNKTATCVVGGAGKLIDEIRIIPIGARMISYTFRPEFGLQSETDYNGQTRSYTYDNFGRLTTIRDNDHNLLQQVQYHDPQKTLSPVNPTALLVPDDDRSVTAPAVPDIPYQQAMEADGGSEDTAHTEQHTDNGDRQ